VQDEEAAPAEAVQALRARVSFFFANAPSFCVWRGTAEVFDTATIDSTTCQPVAHRELH
jgi:hypothetical protein